MDRQTDRPTDKWTDGGTDKAGCRVACAQPVIVVIVNVSIVFAVLARGRVDKWTNKGPLLFYRTSFPLSHCPKSQIMCKCTFVFGDSLLRTLQSSSSSSSSSSSLYHELIMDRSKTNLPIVHSHVLWPRSFLPLMNFIDANIIDVVFIGFFIDFRPFGLEERYSSFHVDSERQHILFFHSLTPQFFLILFLD